jgi:hypothetical protein
MPAPLGGCIHGCRRTWQGTIAHRACRTKAADRDSPGGTGEVATSLLFMLPLLALVIVATVAEMLSGRLGQGPSLPFVALVPLLFLIMGFRMIKALLWELAGKETIELSSSALWHSKQIPFFRRLDRVFMVADISNLRLPPPVARFGARRHMPDFGFEEGALTFDRAGVTHYLGQGLDEAEARYVLDQMRKRVASLRVAPTEGRES